MRKLRAYTFLVVALPIIYHSNLRPVTAGDSLPASLIPFSVLLDRSITLNRFGPWIHDHLWYGPNVVRARGESWYSTYPIAGPLLVTPLYLPLLAFPGLQQMPTERLIMIARVSEKFTAVALTVAAAVWMLTLLTRLTSSAWMLSCVFA